MLALLLMSSVTPPSVERQISVPSFHAVELSVRATMRVEQAPVASVVAKGDPRLVRCVSVTERDGVILIGWAGQNGASKRARASGSDIVVTARADCRRQSSVQGLSVRVAAPFIDAVTIREQGAVQVQPMRVQAFAANIPGRGSITIAALRAGSTKLSVAGNGRIDVAGELGRLVISVPGTSVIDAKAANASAIDLSVAGQASIAVTVNGPASGSIAGKGVIAISGRPVCAIRNVGKGRVICPAAANKAGRA